MLNLKKIGLFILLILSVHVLTSRTIEVTGDNSKDCEITGFGKYEYNNILYLKCTKKEFKVSVSHNKFEKYNDLDWLKKSLSVSFDNESRCISQIKGEGINKFYLKNIFGSCKKVDGPEFMSETSKKIERYFRTTRSNNTLVMP